jgi:hypothetical protein
MKSQTFEEYRDKYDNLRMRREDGILEVALHTEGGTGSMLRPTESRPVEAYRSSNRGDSVGFPASGRTITSSIWRRIRMGTAALADAGSPTNPRGYRWGRKRSRSYTEGSGGKSGG